MALKIAKKSTKKPLIITLIILLVAAGGYTVFAYKNDIWPFAKNETKESEQTEAGNDNSQDTTRQSQSNTIENGNTKETSTNGTDEQRDNKNLIPGNRVGEGSGLTAPTISRATKSDSTIEVVATFDETVNGSCELTLTGSGESITRTSPITVGPSYYLCGFTVENVNDSNWTAHVTHTNKGQKSKSVSQKVSQ